LFKLVIAVLAAITATLVIFIGLNLKGDVAGRPAFESALAKSYISLPHAEPLQFAPLLTGDNQPFGPQQLQGHWSIFFFGFTACPLVCPRTLLILRAAGRLPSTGVASGDTQEFFVSIDPDRDTPEKVRSYASHFDSHLVGITGSRANIAQFSRQVGAGYQTSSSSIDHSTSLFVVDPQGRLAGIVLRPSEPSQVASDFAHIRSSAAPKSDFKNSE